MTDNSSATHTKPSRRRGRRVLAEKIGLHMVCAGDLTIRRRKSGRGFAYYSAEGRKITNARAVRRLNALAVPPAYKDVRLADDEKAHLQAIGRDAAGRLQYRYHADWTIVRETQKAEHLNRLLDALPRIRRGLTKHLGSCKPTRELALAAIVELVAHTSIRAGREVYARDHGTRGAATLLKSNVTLRDGKLALNFIAKGGKEMQKEIGGGRLLTAVRQLRKLAGPRLFQYLDEDGAVRTVRAREVNTFLLELSGVEITLKDFRTLCACVTTLEAVLRVPLASNSHRRSRQLREAVKIAASELGNTPAMCRKSYVRAVVDTLESQRAVTKLTAACANGKRPKPEKVLSDLLQRPRELFVEAVAASA